jgi:hypothetical protein
MGRARSLLRSLAVGTAGRRHACKTNKDHVLVKGDMMLVVKIDRDEFHYCVDCALTFIATARTKLTALESELRPPV